MGAKTKQIKGGILYLTGKFTKSNVKKIRGIGRILEGKVQSKLKLS